MKLSKQFDEKILLLIYLYQLSDPSILYKDKEMIEYLFLSNLFTLVEI